MKLSRWRPVCPDCGYSLRGSTSDRCPECGVPYPTTARTYRRWAIRRLPWDRLNRGILLIAYLKSLFLILITPCWAGRHLAQPDRWGRAIRWAVVHCVILAIAATMLCYDCTFSMWIWRRFVPDPLFHPLFYMQVPAPASRILVWSLQSLVAWFVFLASVPATGVALTLLWPRRHRAWKATAAKWSLYATAALVPALAAWYGYYLVFPPLSPPPGGITIYTLGPPPDMPAWFAAIVYATIWTLGVMRNTYRSLIRRRLVKRICNPDYPLSISMWWWLRWRPLVPVCVWISACIIYGGLYFGLWLLMVRCAFPPAGLGALT